MRIWSKSRETSRCHSFWMGAPALVWQVLFFYIPLCITCAFSFLEVADNHVYRFTLQKIAYFINPIYIKVISLSLLLAISNALICFLMGYPVAYFLAFVEKKVKALFLFLLFVPFWTNFLMHVYAWFYVLEKHGFINNLLIRFRILETPLTLLNSPFAIMIMMVYFYLPFMVLPIYSSLERLNRSLMEASFDLGASWFQTFRRITLPLTMRGVRAGFFLTFIPSFGEFAIPSLMGGDKIMFVGNVISEFMLAEGTNALGSAFVLIASFILIIITLTFYWLLGQFIPGKGQYV